MSVGNAGIRRGAKVDGLRAPTAHVQVDPRVADLDRGARFAQLHQHRIEVLRPRAFDLHVTAGDRAGHQIGAGLDAIGQHVVARAVQALHALRR